MKFYKKTGKRIDAYDQRFYPVIKDGKELMYENVTNILGVVSKGYYYDEWLMTNGLEARYLRDSQGVKGQKLHGMAEDWLRGNRVLYNSLTYGDYFNFGIWKRFFRWLKFYRDFKDKLEYQEKNVEIIVHSHDMEYAGTCDLLCKLEGEPVIYDWKFGNEIYKSSDQQMIAYMIAINEMYGIDVKRGFICHIPERNKTKKGYSIHEVKLTPELIEVWQATLTIKRYYEPEKPRIETYPIEISKHDKWEEVEKMLNKI